MFKFVAVMTVFAAVLCAQGQYPGRDKSGGPPRGPRPWWDGNIAKNANLSDAQQTQIKQIMAKEKPALEPLFQQEMQSHEQMMQLIQSGSFDEAKATAIANQGAQIHAQLEVQHARVASEAYQVLTAEQKTKLAQFITKREQRFEQHMQEQGAHSEQAPNQ